MLTAYKYSNFFFQRFTSPFVKKYELHGHPLKNNYICNMHI